MYRRILKIFVITMDFIFNKYFINMKHIILSIALLLCTVTGFSQTSSESIYIVLTSVVNPGSGRLDGVSRYSPPASSELNIGKYPPIHFIIDSGQLLFMLSHYNFDLEKLRALRQPADDGSDEMEILTKPESFLKEISCIDLDAMMKMATKEQLWELCDQLQFKKVYVIDRSEIKDGQMKIIQVRAGSSTKPAIHEEVIINGKKYIRVGSTVRED